MTEDRSSKQDKYRTLINQTEATRFKPGQSGNPGGRPKDILTPLLREFLNADNEAEKIAVIKQLISIAKSTGMRGQVAALKEIFDRIDGRVPETHKIESDVPITIVFKEVERKEDADGTG